MKTTQFTALHNQLNANTFDPCNQAHIAYIATKDEVGTTLLTITHQARFTKFLKAIENNIEFCKFVAILGTKVIEADCKSEYLTFLQKNKHSSYGILENAYRKLNNQPINQTIYTILPKALHSFIETGELKKKEANPKIPIPIGAKLPHNNKCLLAATAIGLIITPIITAPISIAGLLTFIASSLISYLLLMEVSHRSKVVS